jgi:hypothetical protein
MYQWKYCIITPFNADIEASDWRRPEPGAARLDA